MKTAIPVVFAQIDAVDTNERVNWMCEEYEFI